MCVADGTSDDRARGRMNHAVRFLTDVARSGVFGAGNVATLVAVRCVIRAERGVTGFAGCCVSGAAVRLTVPTLDNIIGAEGLVAVDAVVLVVRAEFVTAGSTGLPMNETGEVIAGSTGLDVCGTVVVATVRALVGVVIAECITTLRTVHHVPRSEPIGADVTGCDVVVAIEFAIFLAGDRVISTENRLAGRTGKLVRFADRLATVGARFGMRARVRFTAVDTVGGVALTRQFLATSTL